MPPSSSLDAIVTRLVPSLSRSLAEQFNVFRVMHHGTHEKQLSNVFSWLLRPDATHGLGDRFQQVFLRRVNQALPVERQLPITGFDQVDQEVDTVGGAGEGRDIADIVLTHRDARVVIENFGTSDGHGHDYHHYLTHGRAGGRQGVVVLLCVRHEPHRQVDGWQDAVVTTYAEVLEDLRALVSGDAAWQRRHVPQHFFLTELFSHFLEGPSSMTLGDRLDFLKMMCDTGESDRFGYRPQDTAAAEFANLVAQHARQQFDEGRKTLAQVKRALKGYANQTLKGQLNERLRRGQVTAIDARFVGKWEWCVTLRRSDAAPAVFLTFGPSAVVENARVAEPVTDPDYGKVFVTRQGPGGEGVDRHTQTDVGLDEVLAGLDAQDHRLRDAILAISAAPSS